MSFTTDAHAIVDAWQDSDLPTKDIADLTAALARYDGLGADLRTCRASAGGALHAVAAQVAVGDLTLADGVQELAHGTVGEQHIPSGHATHLDALFNESRRYARRDVEAALQRIDWPAVLTNPKASDELRFAIRSTGVMQQRGTR